MPDCKMLIVPSLGYLQCGEARAEGPQVQAEASAEKGY